MQPYAMWIDDCQGKKDFDGPLISVSARYYPGPGEGGSMTYDTATGQFGTVPYGKQPSANTAIHLNIGPREKDDGGADYLIWRRAEFEGATETEVKSLVETWVSAQMADIVALLGGLFVGKKPDTTMREEP